MKKLGKRDGGVGRKRMRGRGGRTRDSMGKGVYSIFVLPGFAELQTDLDELTGDVAGCRLPYRDLQTFFMSTLFPDHTKDHPVLHQVEVGKAGLGHV